MDKNKASSKNEVSPNLIEKNKARRNVAASLQKLHLTPSAFWQCGCKFGNLFVEKCQLQEHLVRRQNLQVYLPCVSELLGNIWRTSLWIWIALATIARRRKLLNDDVMVSLADSSWEILDISGSDVSDSGLEVVANRCKSLRAVDISQCDKITATGVSELVQHCQSLETLRCGGSPRSNHTARTCLGILKPKLNDVEGESWEELDTTEIGVGAQSLRWFVWPNIDKDSLEMLSTECPRIMVNPKPSPFRFRGFEVPREAFPYITLDDPFVKDVDPQTWAVCRFTAKTMSLSLGNPKELPIAERFRLAYVERDTRLAPKRAKNARQHQRRAEREWMMGSTSAKAIALASKATKSLHTRK